MWCNSTHKTLFRILFKMFGHLGFICGFIYILNCNLEPRQYGAAVYVLVLVKCDCFYSGRTIKCGQKLTWS